MKTIGNILADKRKSILEHHESQKKRNERQIVRSMNKLMKDIGTFSSVELQDHAGLARTFSNSTVRRFLIRNDFGFCQCRRKGQLIPEDLDKRLKFCKKCKQLPNDFCETGTSFYLDGTGFVHKTNPCKSVRTTRTRMWRKGGKDLKGSTLPRGRKKARVVE